MVEVARLRGAFFGLIHGNVQCVTSQQQANTFLKGIIILVSLSPFAVAVAVAGELAWLAVPQVISHLVCWYES